MANRALWSFLFALSALQSSWSAPISARLQLEYEVANELFQLATTQLEEFKDFFQRVIDQAEHILPPDSKSVLLEMCQELVNVLNPMDIEDSFEMERIREALEDITSLHDTLDSSELSSEAEEIVLAIFEQYGGEDIQRKMEDQVAEALQRIEQKLADYISTWSESRLERNKEFLKWFKDFKNEEDTYEKLELLVESDLF